MPILGPRRPSKFAKMCSIHPEHTKVMYPIMQFAQPSISVATIKPKSKINCSFQHIQHNHLDTIN